MGVTEEWVLSVGDHPELFELLTGGDGTSDPIMTSYPFLSAKSANAVISDLRPTTLSPPALDHINLLLDEVLSALITAAQSLNPRDLRSTGIPAVFSSGTGGQGHGESTGIKALARAAVAEAEVEVRSWYETNPGPKTGFPPGNQGRGMVASKEAGNAKFPLDNAITLLRIKCASFSTYAPSPPPPEDDVDELLHAWKQAGGDDTEGTTEIAGLWMTGVLEHICEHVLQQLGRVVSRDSGITVASVQDLYTAIAEDESVWGFVKRLKVKDSLEQAVQSAHAPKSRKGTPSRPSQDTDRFSPSPYQSRTSLANDATTPVAARDASIDSARKSGSSPRVEESSRLGGIASVARKGSSMSKRFGVGHGHDRKESGLSVNTRQIVNAYNEAAESEDGSKRSKSPQDEEDEFDALVRSGETMKVSLTPSRLKTFDAGAAGRRGIEAQSAQPPGANRRGRAGSVPAESTPPLPSSDTIPSLSHSVSASLSTPPRASPHRQTPAQRGAPSSASRLQPRGATTIEEKTDEEDATAGAKQRKESLKDVFASAPSEQSSPQSHKRTAPAIILGGPPPGSNSASAHPSEPTPPTENAVVRKRSPTRSTVQDDETNTGSALTPATSRSVSRPQSTHRVPRSSEARELADFFNSTPPPSKHQPKAPSVDNTQKSSKGFRGLMSKVTGGSSNSASKKRAEERRLAMENQIMEIPTAPSSAAAIARRQRSMASVQSSATAPQPTTSLRNGRAGSEDLSAPPDIPSKGVLRKRSDTAQTTGAAAAATAAAAAGAAAGAGAILVKKETTTTSAHRSSPPLPPKSDQTKPQRYPSPDRNGSKGPILTLGDEEARSANTPQSQALPPVPVSQDAASPSHDRDEGVTENHSSRYQQGASRRDPVPESLNATQIPSRALPTPSSIPKPPVSSVADMTTTPPRPTHAERAPTTASDANSFITADEGEGSGSDEGQNGLSTTTGLKKPEPDNVHQPRTVSEEAQQPVIAPVLGAEEGGESTEPSIPLGKLVALRSLLQHATSVAECRLLLSAILTQLGVPVDENFDEAQPDAETRITAWLLAGGEGPPASGRLERGGEVASKPASDGQNKLPDPTNSAKTAGDKATTTATTSTALVTGPDDGEGTPRPTHAPLPSISAGPEIPSENAEHPHSEELISESGSVISTLEDEVTTGYAQAGQRSSPVRLARAV